MPGNDRDHRRGRVYRLRAGRTSERRGALRSRHRRSLRHRGQMAKHRQTRFFRNRAGRRPLRLARPLWREARGGVSPRRHLGDDVQRRRCDDRQQPELLDRAVALVRRRPQAADLRLLGSDLRRRLGRVRRCRRHRGAQASAPAQPLWLVKARLRSVGDASGGGETRHRSG